MPTGDDLDSRDSVEERPLSAAKLSAPSETHICCLSPCDCAKYSVANLVCIDCSFGWGK